MTSLKAFVLLVAVFTVGTLLFTTSMLSKTNVLSTVATTRCDAAYRSGSPLEAMNEGKEREPFVDQIIVILIDALRPDFALSELRKFSAQVGGADGSCTWLAAEEAQNRVRRGDTSRDVPYSGATLTYIEESLKDPDEMSHGFFFVADSPTTTSQRLKALVTGTVPGFLEAGSNFNSDAVVEDSIIQQLHNRSAVFGDDTWLALFPKRVERGDNVPWKQDRVFLSFNVSDFDTNDAGVQSVLYDAIHAETKEKDPNAYAKLMIAHFLGIDHVGHRISSDNAHMERKLGEFNVMLRRVGQTLLARPTGMRTMLMVLGDHGMTNSGDHGGDTAQETDSFLFAQLFNGGGGKYAQPHTAYANAEHKAAVRASCSERWSSEVDSDLTRLSTCRSASGVVPDKMSAIHQVDVTPTLSLLLGVPIPFSNLGRVVPELVLLADPTADVPALEQCNVAQLRRIFREGSLRPSSNQSTPWDTRVEDAAAAAIHRNRKSEVNAEWRGMPLRRVLARMSDYARKSRTEVQFTSLFIGAVITLLCPMASVWTRGCQWVLQYFVGAMWMKRSLDNHAKKRQQQQQPNQSDRKATGTGARRAIARDDGVVPATLDAEEVMRNAISSSSTARVQPGWHCANFLGLIIVIMIFTRHVIVFANSFIVNEDNEVSMLLCVMLVISAGVVAAFETSSFNAAKEKLGRRWRARHGVPSPVRDNAARERGKDTASAPDVGTIFTKYRSAFALLAMASFVRFVVPLMWRKRSHGTHVVQSQSILQEFLVAFPAHVGQATSSTHVEALASSMLSVSWLILGSAVFALQVPRSRLSVVALIAVMMYACNGRVVEHHAVPLTMFLIARFAVRYRAAAYMILALWTSSLCNESHATAIAMAVFGTSLPLLLNHMSRLPCVMQTTTLFFYGTAAFFAQGDQYTFSTIDWNASFVGLPHYNMIAGGVLVMSRTFAVFLLIPIAIRVFQQNPQIARQMQFDYMQLMFATATCSCISAFILRRHLMLYAVFGPKMIFDIVSGFMCVIGILLSMLM